MRYLLSIFLLIVVSTATKAQSVLWGKQFYNQGDEHEGAFVIDLATDHDGNVYVLYNLHGSVEIEGAQHQSAGVSDVLVVKRNANGDFQWAVQMGGSGYDVGRDIDVGPQGELNLTAYTEGGNYLGETMPKGGVLLRMTGTSALVWARPLGNLVPGSMVVDPQDATFVTARSESGIEIRKYGIDGSLIWSNPILYLSCCVNPSLVQIEQDVDGNIIAVGDFSGRISFSGHIMTSAKFSSTFIVKMNSQGQYIWFRQIDSKGTALDDAKPTAFALDPSGNIYLTGFFTHSAAIGSHLLQVKNDNDDRTGFVTRISPTGSFEWAFPLYSRDVIPAGIAYSPRSEIYLVGGARQYLEYDDKYISSAPSAHSFVLTIDVDGAFRQFRVINNESYPTYAHSLALSQQDELVVAGNFNADFSAGCVDFTGNGWVTDFVLKLGASSSVIVAPVEASGLCAGDAAVITVGSVDTATKYIWSFSEGLVPVDLVYETPTPEITVTLGDAGQEVWAKVIPVFDCEEEVEAMAHFTISGMPGKPKPPTGKSWICIGEENTYTVAAANEGTTYEWQLSDNLLELRHGTSSITVSTSVKDAPATMRVRAANACGESEWSEQLSIQLHTSQQKPEIEGVSAWCAGAEKIQFVSTAPGGAKVGWMVENDAVIQNALPDSITIFVNMPFGIPAVSIRSKATGLCETAWSDVFVVNLMQPPLKITSIDGPAQACRDSDAELVFNAEPVQDDVSYQWSFPEGFSAVQQDGNRLTLKADGASTGAITAFTFNACFSTSPESSQIVVGTPPELPTIERLPCDRGLVYRGTDWYEWHFNDQPLQGEPRGLMILESGLYRLTTANECGSVTTEDFEMVPVVEGNVFIPNVVTDNGDGRNDKFVIDASLKNASVLIVNRWGTEVFSSADYDNSWSGSTVASGIYFYYVHHGCLQKPLRGWVQVIR